MVGRAMHITGTCYARSGSRARRQHDSRHVAHQQMFSKLFWQSAERVLIKHHNMLGPMCCACWSGHEEMGKVSEHVGKRKHLETQEINVVF